MSAKSMSDSVEHANLETSDQESSDLRNAQLEMARYLRDPEREPAPRNIEPRRLKIYQDLVYNNIEGFISSGFPVLRSLYGLNDWTDLVRSFMQNHRCHSPYFLEISQEFLQFLLEDHTARDCDPPYMTELAHYEWVELALDVSVETLPAQRGEANEALPESIPSLSPLAWSLAYGYPVHRIGADDKNMSPQATYLVVYRTPEDTVKFMEINAPTARLLELVQQNHGSTVNELMQILASEMGVELASIFEFGVSQIAEFVEQSIVMLCHSQGAGSA